MYQRGLPPKAPPSWQQLSASMPAEIVPGTPAGDDTGASLNGTAPPVAGGQRKVLLNGGSMPAFIPSARVPGTDGVEAGEAEVDGAQRRASAGGQAESLPPPAEDDGDFDADAITFQGIKLLAGWDELMEEAAKPADRVIGPFQAETLAIASGEAGRGKSLFGIGMSVASAGGVGFGGLMPPRPQSVLIFSPEDKIGVIGARIKAAVEELGADHEVVKRNLRVMRVPESSVIFEGAGEMLDFNALGRLLRRIIKARGARFVMLDPFIELHVADENSNMQVHALLAMLRTLARKTKSLIFLTHHSAKGGQGPRGAGAFMGTVRAALHVESLGKKEEQAAIAKGLNPANIFKVISIKNSYEEDGGGGVYFQRVSLRPGGAPVLRRVKLDVTEEG